jgi:hypothetical protein
MLQGRIELNGVTENAAGEIVVKYTSTRESVLPLSWTGTSKVYSSRQELADYLTQFEAALDEDFVVAVLLAKAMKADPTMGATFRALASGKTGVIDLSGAGTAIAI